MPCVQTSDEILVSTWFNPVQMLFFVIIDFCHCLLGKLTPTDKWFSLKLGTLKLAIDFKSYRGSILTTVPLLIVDRLGG